MLALLAAAAPSVIATIWRPLAYVGGACVILGAVYGAGYHSGAEPGKLASIQSALAASQADASAARSAAGDAAARAEALQAAKAADDAKVQDYEARLSTAAPAPQCALSGDDAGRVRSIGTDAPVSAAPPAAVPDEPDGAPERKHRKGRKGRSG
jgi:hypothetical protein